jgi:poly(3-hydroxybutyrate) depolymerase
VNGVADPVNPYEGGPLILVRLPNGKSLGDRGLHMGAQKTAKFLASNWKDAEYVDRTSEADRGIARREEWRDDGRPVLRLISMEGEGHHVPVPGGS